MSAKKSKKYSTPAVPKTAHTQSVPKTAAPKSSLPGPGRTQWMIASALAALAIVLYANTLGHGFVLDDALVTTLNKYVQRGFGGLGDIFTHSYRAGSSVSTDSEYMYRPMSVATFAAEWAIAPNAPGFHHFMNVLWYALTAGLIYLTFSKLLPKEHPMLALGAALLFVAHPLHTEVVANIKSRDEILSLFFSILCIYYYWDYAVLKVAKRLWPALIAFFLALISKEGAVVLLLILPLALYFFDKNRDFGTAVKQSVWLVAPFLAWLFLRTAIMGGKLAYTPHINDNQLVAAALSERWATGFVVLGKYLQLLLWPATLSWDYSYQQIATVGWTDWKAITALVLHLGLLVYAVLGLKRRAPVSFFILAYFISLALYCNVFILIGTILGERLTYTASLWFCLGIAWLLVRLFRIQREQTDYESIAAVFAGKGAKAMLGVAALIVVAMAGRTITRNSDWKSNFSLFDADRHNAPNSFRTQFAAGEQMLVKFAENKSTSDSATLLQDAAQCFHRSLEIRPTENALTGLGNVAYFQKDYVSAADWYRQSFVLKPENAAIRERVINSYRELARVESQEKHDNVKAVGYLDTALSFDSTNVQTLNLLGTAYGLQNNHKQAIVYFEKAYARAPNDKDVLRNLAIAYRMLGDMAKSDEFAKRAGM